MRSLAFIAFCFVFLLPAVVLGNENRHKSHHAAAERAKEAAQTAAHHKSTHGSHSRHHAREQVRVRDPEECNVSPVLLGLPIDATAFRNEPFISDDGGVMENSEGGEDGDEDKEEEEGPFCKPMPAGEGTCCNGVSDMEMKRLMKEAEQEFLHTFDDVLMEARRNQTQARRDRMESQAGGGGSDSPAVVEGDEEKAQEIHNEFMTFADLTISTEEHLEKEYTSDEFKNCQLAVNFFYQDMMCGLCKPGLYEKYYQGQGKLNVLTGSATEAWAKCEGIMTKIQQKRVAFDKEYRKTTDVIKQEMERYTASFLQQQQQTQAEGSVSMMRRQREAGDSPPVAFAELRELVRVLRDNHARAMGEPSAEPVVDSEEYYPPVDMEMSKAFFFEKYLHKLNPVNFPRVIQYDKLQPAVRLQNAMQITRLAIGKIAKGFYGSDDYVPVKAGVAQPYESSETTEMALYQSGLQSPNGGGTSFVEGGKVSVQQKRTRAPAADSRLPCPNAVTRFGLGALVTSGQDGQQKLVGACGKNGASAVKPFAKTAESKGQKGTGSSADKEKGDDREEVDDVEDEEGAMSLLEVGQQQLTSSSNSNTGGHLALRLTRAFEDPVMSILARNTNDAKEGAGSGDGGETTTTTTVATTTTNAPRTLTTNGFENPSGPEVIFSEDGVEVTSKSSRQNYDEEYKKKMKEESGGFRSGAGVISLFCVVLSLGFSVRGERG